MKQNEMSYQVTMVIFAQLLKDGLITPEEYVVMDTKMQEKYAPKIGTLFTEKPLTNSLKDGSMVY